MFYQTPVRDVEMTHHEDRFDMIFKSIVETVKEKTGADSELSKDVDVIYQNARPRNTRTKSKKEETSNGL